MSVYSLFYEYFVAADSDSHGRQKIDKNLEIISYEKFHRNSAYVEKALEFLREQDLLDVRKIEVGCFDMTPKLIEYIADIINLSVNLEEFSLSCSRCDTSSLFMSITNNIKIISLDDCSFGDNDVDALLNIGGIECLTLHETFITEDGLSILFENPDMWNKLRKLHITGTQISTKFLHQLSQCEFIQQLESLKLTRADMHSKEHYSVLCENILPAISRLEELDIGVNKMTKEVLEHFAQVFPEMPHLTILGIGGICKNEVDEIGYIFPISKKCMGLKELNCAGNVFFNMSLKEFRRASFDWLGLRSVNFSYCNFNRGNIPQFLDIFAEFRGLENFAAAYPYYDDSHYNALYKILRNIYENTNVPRVCTFNIGLEPYKSSQVYEKIYDRASLFRIPMFRNLI